MHERTDGPDGAFGVETSAWKFRLLIDGRLIETAQSFAVINPANEQVIAQCPRATPEHLEQAVQAAKRAYPAWSGMPAAKRGSVLFLLADALERNQQRIAELLTLEQGKPIATAQAEVGYAIFFCRYFADTRLEPEIVQDDAGLYVEVHRKPLGVVAGIVPWNFPVLQAVYKMAPALITGNTFVLKPAPTTPLTSLLLAELLSDIVPPGVVNVLSDAGDLGPLLTAHPDVAKVTFTGSTMVGKAVMASAAPSLKRLTLELGGNDAAIVLDDVNVKEVAPKIFNGAFFNSGQACISIKRIYVHRSIYDEMCDELARIAVATRLGNGLDPASELGPLQNKKQFDETKRYVDLAHTYGTVIAGGEVVDGPGYFVRPTIVRDITEGNPLVDEETFGPVRSVLRYDTIDEAVQRANNTAYGLGGSVWGADVAKATEVAARLECGTVWVNQHLHFGPHIPFGGIKQSGLGVEFGKDGVHEFTEVRVISIAKQ